MSVTFSLRATLAVLVGTVSLGLLSAPVAHAQKAKAKPPVKKSAASAVKTYSWKNVKFQSPLVLQGPENYNGDDACNFFYPAGVKPQEDRIRVCMAILDKYGSEQLEARGPVTLVKANVTTLLGLSIDPKETKPRKLLGQDVTGIVEEVNSDKMRHVEAYTVKLPDNTRLFISVEYYGPAHAAKYDAFLEKVISTLALK